MKKCMTILSLIILSSTAFAVDNSVKCDRAIYAAAVKNLLKINVAATGITIKLEEVKKMEGTERTYIASLAMTDGTASSRYDSYRVVLARDGSCKVVSSQLMTD